MSNTELIAKIRTSDQFTDQEKAEMIGLLNRRKKYGLVWEEKPEAVEQKLRDYHPVLKEVVERRIVATKPTKAVAESKEAEQMTFDLVAEPSPEEAAPVVSKPETESLAPNHVLIEGDNLHALQVLSFTHQKSIDVIYIDPPYNTGAKDWRYNNDYVDSNDGYRHSKWLGFMDKRLRIAKTLLVDEGVIIVTIDDYEFPRLYMLMEEIFGEQMHLGTIAIRNNPSGRSTVKGVSIAHEYALVFGKTETARVGRLPRNERQTNRYNEEDSKGQFEWVNFRKHGGTKNESPSMFYPVFVTQDDFRIPKIEWDKELREWILKEEPKAGEKVLYPIDDNGKERRWKWGLDRVLANPEEFSIRKDRKKELGLYVKARMNMKGVLPDTWWEAKKYSSTAYGTNLIKEIFSDLQVFSYPKSLWAVLDALLVGTNKKDGVFLDFFAGSGTTLHATMQLNAEDGGARQCILVTNNENNIAEEVCYERNKRVIQGYINAKGEAVAGLSNNNLRYYRCDFVEQGTLQSQRRALVKHATDLLCIKEDCYEEVDLAEQGLSTTQSVRLLQVPHTI